MGKTLPDFDDPPVIETLLGVEFATLSKWAIPHFGLFWDKIKTEYPRFEQHPPIVSQQETFAKADPRAPMMFVEVIPQIPIRCWFIHQSETRLLQIQNDRFIHNWRKVATADTYPHYENIQPIFVQEWTRFCEFLESQQIGSADVRQCEITYINHFEPGRGWSTLADLSEVIGTKVGAGTDRFLPTPESIGLNTSYVMPAEQGRLHVQLQSVIRHKDAAEILQLTLTARGRPASSQLTDLLHWFDLGREWVVRGFSDFTTAKMHQIWKRKV